MRLPRVQITVRRMMLVVALLTPLLLVFRAADQAREAARRTGCEGDMFYLAYHLRVYHDVYGSFPTGTVANPALPPGRRLSWVVELSPGFQSWAFPRIDRSRGWDEPPNWPLRFGTPPGVTVLGVTPGDAFNFLTCPDDPARTAKNGQRPLSYVGVAGLGPDAPSLPSGHRRAGVFGYDRATRLADITDGKSQTMMLVETARVRNPWTAGGPATVRGVDPALRPYLGPGRPFGSHHRGGSHVAFADGSVRFLRDTIDPRVFEALSTVAGGEPLPAGWDR